MAPVTSEQAEGKPVDARSDIFSFGSVLYEMLTGQRAFQGETKISTLAAILHGEPKPPSQLADVVPREVERVVERCLRKDPQRRWQGMSDLKVALQDLKEESESGKLSAVAVAPRTAGRRNWLLASLAGLVFLIAGGAAAWWIFGRGSGPVATEPERITFESRVVFWPAISPDGKLIAYASDRNGNFDVYVRQLAGRQTIRLTQHPAADWYPCFSPDGSKVVFRSERDGGGLYVVEALGGVERKIVDGGRLPAFSPDGSTIVYLVASALTRTARLFLVPAEGGVPRQLQSGFVIPPAGGSHSSPLWSADGKQILFEGMRAGDPKSRDWWLAPVAGGEAVRIKAPPRGESRWVRAVVAWWHGYVYYSEGSTVGGMILYRVRLSQDSHPVSGVPEKVTSPAGMQYGASISNDGRMIYSTMSPGVNIWSVPLRSSDGVASGPPESLTSDSMGKLDVAAASDGSRFAWMAYSSTQGEIRIREPATGREESIPLSLKTLSVTPRLSRDGSRLGYSDIADGKLVAYVRETGAATPQQVCENCSILDFYSRTPAVLVQAGNRLARLEIGGGSPSPVLDAAGQGRLFEAALAPSDLWVAFTLARPNGTAALFVADVAQPAAAKWTKIAEDRNYVGAPSWSSDGRILYYSSSRDSFLCIWAQRFTAGGKLDGAPFAAFHSHAVPNMAIYGVSRVKATRDRLYMLLSDFKGDLWSLKLLR